MSVYIIYNNVWYTLWYLILNHIILIDYMTLIIILNGWKYYYYYLITILALFESINNFIVLVNIVGHIRLLI